MNASMALPPITALSTGGSSVVPFGTTLALMTASWRVREKREASPTTRARARQRTADVMSGM